MGLSNHGEYATRPTPRRHAEFFCRLPFIKDALASRAAIWEGRARMIRRSGNRFADKIMRPCSLRAIGRKTGAHFC
jgi:hypothetical protein